MLKSFVVAFSTYSRIPMPRVKWDEKSMRYCICWFPFVGLVIGAFMMGCHRLCEWMEMNVFVQGVVFTALPILLTGGIHMDGFMDTVDAKNSYRSKEERLEILKDPHVGAFALLYCCLYLIASVVIFASLDEIKLLFVAMGYVYSRILSGLSVVTFKKAKDDGMLSETARNSAMGVKWIMVTELIAFIAIILTVANFCVAYTDNTSVIWYGVVVLVAGLLSFLYYSYMAKKWFGGITGDLAGYFLQICEMAILISLGFIG